VEAGPRQRVLAVRRTSRGQATAYAAVLPLIAGGQIAPAHDRSFTLERAPEALRHLIEDRPFGTVTLTVDALSVR
jgi:NADPH:quinone reductase-like Zn-dependent oxidoreductase